MPPQLAKIFGRENTEKKANGFLEKGNLARDQRDWVEATSAYLEYLKSNPDDQSIWVQAGHALKEKGDHTQAEDAYRRAVDLNQGDAESRLHLAHLLKNLGRRSEAADLFLEILKILPSQEIFDELEALDFKESALMVIKKLENGAQSGSVFLELRDLFQYLEQHSTVTGISRVVLSLVDFVVNVMSQDRALHFKFVHQIGDGDGLSLISKASLKKLVQFATADTINHAATISLIREARKSATLIHLAQGDSYFIPGAFWDAASNPSFLPALKRDGVRIGAYLYDLIPITHAHYCMAGLTQGFNIAFSETVPFYDFALTISKYVAEEVTGFLDRHDLERFPVAPVPLAHEVTFEGHAHANRRPSARLVGEMQGREFVLCVCTIEARKNHTYLFYIWQQMIREGIDVPDLVFVGRQGWRVNDLYEQMAASDYLNGRLHVLSGLPDADLEFLYKGCLFTVFPSFVEGWGLPVGESLAHGKVCVASSTSSIPEVAGDLVIYIDPFNQASGYETIAGLITDRARLKVSEDRIRSEFKARTWRQVGADFFSALERSIEALPPVVEREDVFVPSIASGQMLELTELDSWTMRRPEYIRNPQRLAFAEGWQRVAADGVKMNGVEAQLEFRADCEPGRSVQVLVLVSTSASVTPETLLSAQGHERRRELATSRGNHRRPLQPNERFWLKIPTNVLPSGRVSIRFRIDGELPSNPSEGYAARVHAVGYAAIDDSAARLNLLERASLGV